MLLDFNGFLTETELKEANKVYLLDASVLEYFPSGFLVQFPKKFFTVESAFSPLEKKAAEVSDTAEKYNSLKKQESELSTILEKASKTEKTLYSEGWGWWTFSMLDEKQYELFNGLVSKTREDISYIIEFDSNSWNTFLPYYERLCGFFNTHPFDINVELDYVGMTATIGRKGLKSAKTKNLRYDDFDSFYNDFALMAREKASWLLDETRKEISETKVTEEDMNLAGVYRFFQENPGNIIHNPKAPPELEDMIRRLEIPGTDKDVLRAAYGFDFPANGAAVKENYGSRIVTANPGMKSEVDSINGKRGAITVNAPKVRAYLFSLR